MPDAWGLSSMETSVSEVVISQDPQDDTEDEDDGHPEDSADLCSASHEFEWLSPQEKPGTQIYTSEPHQSSSCQVSPARHPSNHVRPRRSDVRMSQIEYHGCRRYLSPMRSTWCCPSPPSVCLHHGDPYLYECCRSDISFQNSVCLHPNGLVHTPRHQESHTWCHNSSPHHEIVRRESPCAMYRSCPGSRSTRKRDHSPISPRYSPPVPNERQEQWQSPSHTEETNSFQKLQDLESDKKNLILQACVLGDQVEAQAEKISELEKLLDHKKDELMQLKQNLQQEALARSSVENSKIELVTELSNLRLRLTAAERDWKESDDKYRKLESELVSFRARLTDRETEHAILKSRLSQNNTQVFSTNENSEVEKMRSTLDSFVSNDEKVHPSLPTAPIPTQFNRAIQSQCSLKVSDPVSNTSAFYRSNSVENICPSVKEMTTNSQYGTMPRQIGSQILHQLQVQLREHKVDVDTITKTSTLKQTDSPKNGNNLKIGCKNNEESGRPSGKSSGVSFATQESIAIISTEKENLEYSVPLTPQPYLIKTEKDKKGFLKFFSKWKKSGFQNIHGEEGDFKRGGIRATAGPRLGWSRDIPQDPDIPFCHWSADMIVEWLHRLGLSMYASECKRSMCNGEMLSKLSTNDLEKVLGIKNPLHKKKLILSIKNMNSGLPDLPILINSLDHHWVVRWLDDVGLPQYKDSFAEARVDGRVLHFLTIEDLLFLKVTSQVHHFSIKRGIQLLREKGFNPHCLIRRSLPDEVKTYTPELVALWSNHRVMEWLRTVDLSEYAPNLRGSGVHGALIVYESKFNTNLFATLLNIPPAKTLLRRHLATHFKHIVGDELTQLKREKETEVPLSPSIKVKGVRKTQFALKKKRNKNEFENEDYVCPMDTPVATTIPKLFEGDKLVVRRNSDPSPHTQEHKQMDLEIILQDENLNKAPTTIV